MILGNMKNSMSFDPFVGPFGVADVARVGFLCGPRDKFLISDVRRIPQEPCCPSFVYLSDPDPWDYPTALMRSLQTANS